MKFYKRFLLGVCMTLILAGELYSQVTELDPVVVSASLERQRISQTGRNIIVVRGETINDLPVHSIDELLRYLPGVEMQARGPQGTQSDILLRGGTFQQVLVILDGIRLNDPLTGHFNAYIPVSPAEIERIEILKGTASAIYGSDAVGGVVYIVSKTFAARKDRKAKELSGHVTMGEYGMINGGLGGFFQNKSTCVAGGILTNNADGPLQRGTRGFFHNTTLSASVKHFLKDSTWSIGWRTAYDNRDFSAQNFYTAFTSDTATEKVTSWWNHLQLAFQKRKFGFSFDAGYKNAKDNYLFNRAALPNLNRSSLFQTLARVSYKIDDASVITSGLQYVRSSIRSNDRGDHSLAQAAAFVVLDQRVTPVWDIHPAVRVDWNQRSGWELVPQLSSSYRLDQLIIRAMLGRSIRNADFTERYNNYNKPLVTSGNIGNPDLAPEYSFAYEAGADYFVGRGLKLSATWFQKSYDRLIDWVLTDYDDMPRKENLSPSGSYYLASNISSVRTRGWEADLQFNRRLNKEQTFFMLLGCLWVKSDDEGAAPSLYISSHARWLFNYSFYYRYRNWQLSINGLYKSREEQKGNAALAPLARDYYVMNLRLLAGLGRQGFSLFIGADNILDKQYADRFGVPMPGRWWSGGMQFRFVKQ